MYGPDLILNWPVTSPFIDDFSIKTSIYKWIFPLKPPFIDDFPMINISRSFPMFDPPPTEIAQRSIHLGLHRSWALMGRPFCVNRSLQGVFALMIIHIHSLYMFTHAYIYIIKCMYVYNVMQCHVMQCNVMYVHIKSYKLVIVHVFKVIQALCT